MEKYFTMDELHKILLDMLVCIDKFCRENNIRYSLGGGTLLGAIRHKGFIPWDDDVDIMMPRPDYDRFRKEFNGFDERYECIFCEKTKYADYIHSFAKVHDIRTVIEDGTAVSQNTYGIYIDIFPVDGMFTSSRLCKFHIKSGIQTRHIIATKNMTYRETSTISEFIKKCLSSLVPRMIVGKIMDSVLSCVKYEKAEYAGAVGGRYQMKERYTKDVFESYIDATFEGLQLRIIEKYDIYLTQHYGNYMALPPVEQRENHCSKAYWR